MKSGWNRRFESYKSMALIYNCDKENDVTLNIISNAQVFNVYPLTVDEKKTPSVSAHPLPTVCAEKRQQQLHEE